MTRLRGSLAVLAAFVCLGSARGGDIDHKDLLIAGLSLEVDTTTVVANVGIPAAVQTKFGGRINADAPPDNGMTAVGDLTGPGLDTPIRLVTKPGHLFQLPALNEKGDYILRNIRLVSAEGNVLQIAVPSFANITIAQVLDTKLSVHQLTPDDLRARGITLNSNNYDVYEYTFLFAINGQTVSVPYPVIIDKRTHEVINAPATDPYNMPALPSHATPPRFYRPPVFPMPLVAFGDSPGVPDSSEKEPHRVVPGIPAAIVIPTGLGVLHQFFAVILNIGNSAPAGSAITVDSITATIDAPLGLRLAKTTPAVTIGQAVPVVDARTGAHFLVAAAQGSAEWSLEALKAGTHTVAVHLRATYKAPNQPDTPLKGDLSASFVVNDPRFQVNFVHPQTIRGGEEYTAYAFITNTSATAQTIRLDVGQIPVCSGDASWSNFNVCFPQTMDPVEATIDRGKTLTVPYHLKSRLTGSIFASAGQADDNIKVGVSLSMGVSASGIPLSPATLLMPWYTRYVDPDFVTAQLPLFGLGYSLAVAPLTDRTALLPRVIPDDIYRRAQDVARAGERIFIRRASADVVEPAAEREPLFDLSLDLLSNVEQIDRLPFTPDFKEWDELRRSEDSGRSAAAAMARQLERVGLPAGKSASDFANDFAAATAHRSPYLLAVVHGAAVNGFSRPYAMSVTGRMSHGVLAVPSEAAKPWTRSLPFAELTQFHIPSEYGELAMIGRFSEAIQIDVIPASSDFSVELIYPAATNGSVMRASFRVTNASSNGVSFVIDRGLTNILITGGTYVPVSGPSVVAPPPLAISGAAQDMHLNDEGRTVSLLLNRPITVADPAVVRDLITVTTDVPAIGYHARRRNSASRFYIPGAALQADGRTLDVYFDKTLSKNAAYTIDLDASLVPGGTVHPRIDIDIPSGLLYGKVLRADNTPVADAPVTLQTRDLQQFDRSLDGSVTGNTNDSGRYLFEFIARDDNHSQPGTFRAKTQTANAQVISDGIIRSPGELQQLNLVFLGRGTVTGVVTYSDGRPLAHVTVVAGSAGYNNPLMAEMKSAITGTDGAFTIGDLPVGPFTLSVVDAAGNISYAANQIHLPGELLRQDLVVRLRPFPGTGTVRVTVRRSDISPTDPHSLVGGAHVGVFSEGFGLVDGFTDASGRVDFTKIPAGTISVLAANFDLARESIGVEADLHTDSTLDEVLTLNVPNAADLAARATLTGTVFRDDPFNPANVTPVPGAIVTVSGFASVTAGGDGKFTYEGIPVALAGEHDVLVFDPGTGRHGSFALPAQLVAGVNPVSFTLASTQPQGHGTMRVRLLDAAGQLVSNYRVLSPGFPATLFKEIVETPGIYELVNVAVPREMDVLAVPRLIDPVYGDQTAGGKVRLDFDGQTATTDLRLPGQGNVIAHLGCAPGVTGCNLDVHAPVVVSYRAWNDSEQRLTVADRRVDPGADGILKITKVPVNQPATVATFENPLGYASAAVEMQFQGQQKDVFLILNSTSTISGRVLNWDRQTPIFGALVHLDGGAANLGSFPTAADGSFRISGVAADSGIRVIAEYSIDGVFRTGFVDAHTPPHGGPISNLVVILQEQASVDGTIVDGTGAPVPLARYWARELSWPYQTHGSFTAPLSADRNGHFVISNVFAGGIHISAQSPQFQEQRGEFEGSIAGEANNLSGVRIVVGAGGTGTITVTVYDGTARVTNAEVTLVKDGIPFDFGQSDGNGIVNFDNVPAGSGYAVRAISRARARAGSSASLTVTQSGVTSVDIGLSVLGVVTGTLVDGETNPERPIAGGHITLSSNNVTLRTSTGAAGAYRFDGVPEGRFVVSGFDFDSGRSTPSPALEFVLTSTIQELTNIKLTLEPTASLDVHVFLPDDAGGPGAAAPLVDVTVSQSAGYQREQQGPGSGLTFPKLFAKAPFHVTAAELGGESRTTQANGSFANGAANGSIALTFPASGTVQVTVASDDPNAAALIASASVTIVTPTKALTLFPDSNGNITATGVQLGAVSATAVSQGLSASASGTLVSRSTPLHLTLMLGHRITMAGHVEAEFGVAQPSVHTRVIAIVSSSVGAFTIETRTDAAGNYSITGVPVGNTSVRFDFYGPDDVTRGAQRTVTVPNGTVNTYPAPNVKIDATGPRVVSIDPPNNANSVAPNSPVTITFTEALDPATVNINTLRVIASDDSRAAPVAITTETLGDGQYRVRLTPTSLLKSNMTYTISIGDSLADPSGNKMTLPVATNFTTVDYTEPRIVATTPSIDQAIGDGTTFYLRFNKAIDASVFASGGSGLLKLEQLDHNHGASVGSPLPISVFVDPKSASTLVVAPVGVALQPASFYRITENGARDTLAPPNTQTTLQTFDFFSADHVRPVATIDAPAAGAKLTAGVDYVATVSIVDEGTNPPHASNDISYVQWFDGAGKALTRATTPPYGYVLRAATGVASVTLKASAVDLSGNASDLAAQTWEVTPNLPPQNIAITVPPSAYVARTIALSATFEEDGLAVTSALAVTAKHRDGSPYAFDAARIHRVSAQPIRRNAIAEAWVPVQYTIDVPADVKEADALQMVLTLTDADNQSASKTASVDILADTNPPHITAMLPAGETRYKFGDLSRNHYRAQVSVTDAESGVAHVTFVIDGHTTDVKFGDAGSSYANGTYTFFADADVSAKNVDTRIHIAATAFDYDGNQTAQTTDVIYESVNDGTAPMGSWVTPLDGALVAKGNVTLMLRVHATDDIHVDSVTFDSALFSSVTADRLPNDIFEKSVTFDTPADGSSFVINATISDSGHQTVVPITIDQIVPDIDLATDSQINNGNAATYANKTVRIHGAGKKLYISVPVTLQNLIVADGAMAGNPDGTKIDLTVRDRLYVDGASAIDVTGKGFLGGWASHESGGQNATTNGLTLGNAPGAAPAATGSFFASGSYAGLAGADSGSNTNATYGSITNPTDFGSGGSGNPDCNFTCLGGNGGGVVVINGGAGINDKSRFVIAGGIRADGQTGVNIAGAGSGGSINLHARALVAGWGTRITANGGDDDGAANTSRGGGGGRIATVISDRWDVEPTQAILQARGGRNDSTTEARAFLDAGAGTLFVQKPGEANGELLVSSFDERHSPSLHVTRSTPLAGTLSFDSIAIGPRALARFDNDYTASNVTTDASAVLLRPADLPAINLVTAPTAGTPLIQGSTLALTYNAQSNAGIGEVRATLAPAADLVLPSFDYPASVATTPANVIVPNNATPGAVTLKLRVTDRAGRTAETASTSYTIVANTGPAITQFDVAPASLQMYAGHPITVTAAASDDLEVRTLTLTSSAGTIAPVTPLPNPATHGLTATFVVTIPPTTASGTVAALTLKATDGSGVIASQSKNVTILHDSNPPSVTASAPSTVQESANATFTVTATITDAEVGVLSADAAFDGKHYPLSFNAGAQNWSAVIPVPNVDGTQPVPKSLVVTARDYENNIGTSATLTVNVVPLVDSNGPTINWLCASPGAVYPAGTPITLRVVAAGASQANAVQSVQFVVDQQPAINATSTGNSIYETVIMPAAGATSIDVRAVAVSVANNNNDTLTTITLDPTPVITTNLIIDATNTTYDGTKSLLIGAGGNVTITGPHAFRDLAVLDGGMLHADVITADRFFVACNATVDVSALGYPRNTAYPGAGAPANGSAGGHIGRGGKWDPLFGASAGSVYRPQEAGGGGHASDPAANVSGGGALHVNATTSAAIDGVIRANGASASGYGSGAGGSIWITTAGRFAGAGSIDARGGEGSDGFGPGGAGGGGAIALEYDFRSGLLFDDLATHLNARGGTSFNGANGGAGSIYLRGTASIFGDLTIDAKGLVTGTTELPPFGKAVVTSVASKTAVLDSLYIPPYFAGHYLNVTAADGTPRGTWRIASVTNGPSARAFGGFATIRTTDAAAYDGYLLHSDHGYTVAGQNAQWIAARFNAGQWQYDNDAAFVNFTPDSGDRIFASFSKDAVSIATVTPIACCATINGVATAQLVSGELLANVDDVTGQVPYANPSEFMLRPDSSGRGVVIASEPSSVTLEDAADIRAGDHVRGAYRFDHLTVLGSHVQTSDLLLVTNPIAATSSTIVTANSGAPVIDAAKVTFAPGPTGAVLNGTAGAVSDIDAPLQIIAHNDTRGSVPPQRFALQNAQNVTIGTNGGHSIGRLNNGTGNFGDSGASSIDTLTAGYVFFRASQTDRTLNAGFVVDDTTRDANEPSQNVFHIKNDGTWEVWSAGATTSSASGPYTTATFFRIEKLASAIRWFIDGRKVYELTSAIPPTVRFDVAFTGYGSEINSIVFDRTNAAQSIFTINAAADGSFSLPIEGAAGDNFTLASRDGHVYPATSAEVPLGAFPNTIGLASLIVNPSTVAGGAKSTATVTLRQAAATGGAIVTLTSSSAAAPVPASITVPAGQTSASFTITTASIASPVSAIITAVYAGTTQTATLSVIHDANPPAATITAPSAGAVFIEGSSIVVSATIIDAEVGVKQAAASIDGVSVAMTQDALHPSIWTATLSAPGVDGTTDVPKTITVTASDFENNASTPATVSINVRPIIDALAPVVVWTCATPGAMYPSGATAKLQVLATPASGDSITGVTITITDSAGTRTVPMTSVGNGGYTYDYTLPAVTADASVALRAVASTLGGKSTGLPGSLTIIAPGPNVIAFGADASIAAADTANDGKTVIVTGGTLTVTGQHTFNRLIVLNGASVVHAAADATTTPSLNIIATTTFVACGGAIDATGRGYLAGRTYGNTTTGAPAHATGGSHGGIGGVDPNNSGVTTAAYGSLYDPNEAGSGGALFNGGAQSGGGIIRLQSPSIILDGKITASGAGISNNFVGGAGGSIRIDTTTISGAGEVRADGGAGFFAGGGGGRVAIYYVGAAGQSLTGAVAASGGQSSPNTPPQNGSPGTIYLRQLDGSRAKVTDELILDNGSGRPFGTATPLVDLGSGTITAVSGNVLTLSNPVPEWVAGSAIEIFAANGTVLSSYEISASSSTTVTVIVPNGQTLNAPAGSLYRGSTKIAAITIRNAMLQTPALHGDDMTLKGEIDTTEVRARNLTLKGAAVRQTATTATTTNALQIVATGTLSVDSASVIDATGRGYLAGRTIGNTTTGGPVRATAGSHGGVGGVDLNNGGVPTVAYGSLYDPNEAGSGGALFNGGAISGGGIVRIQSPAIVLDGKITASGAGIPTNFVGGAGGSIRIDATTITGAGEMHADGGAGFFAAGGGGRVAIYYVGAAGQSLIGPVTASGGQSSPNTSPQNGSPGTIYLRQLDGVGSKVTDELILDNGNGRPFGTATPLVDLGSGTITAVNGNLLTLSNPVPDWVGGTTIEVLAANGTVLSSYEISASTSTTVTVIVPNGQTLNVPVGSLYRGSTKIAAITIRNATLQTPALRGDDMTLKGEIDTTEIRARNLTLKGASVRQTATTATVTNALQIVATGTLSVDSASVIDATGRGYLAGRTFGNTTTGAPARATAGSHGGVGGIDPNNGGAATAAYGSLYDPNEAGSGGAPFNGGAMSGGGIVRVQSPAIVLSGKITASGAGISSNFVGGAGGSIRIDTTTISGTGEVHADGGAGCFAGGGGGRVAIYFAGAAGMSLNRAFVTTVSGASNSNNFGAPGTVYLKGSAQTNGELIVDNGPIITSQTTPLTSAGGGFITSVSSSTGGAADTIADTSAAFPIPNQLTGNRVYVNGNKNVLWPTRNNTATALTLDVSANALTAQTGQPYAGLYRFDVLRLRNAKLVSGDAIESLTTIDQDAASTITADPFTAPSITAITASPASVSGGGAITFAVRIAPRTRPTTVNLTSTNPAVPVPASITIPARASSAAFSVTTTSPASAVTATITATAGNTSASTNVTVIPAAAALASITLAPTTVVGGSSSNGTITLSAAAPAGGATVSLSTSNASLAIVPPVVVVPAGSSSASFTVTTGQTGSSNTVAITGIYGITQSATLTVTACSAMSAVTPPASAPLTTVWIDDALPTGATTSGAGALTTAQAASGTQSIGIPAASGARQFAFTGGGPLAVASNDKLVAYLLINPCNPPRQVMLAFSDGSNDYRASWGEDLIETTTAHLRLGTMPAGGAWVRLEVLAASIGAASKNITGLAIKVYDGEAWIDRIGTQTCALATVAPPPSFSPIDTVWFDESLPSGAVAIPSAWNFDTTQHASGATSHKEPLAAGEHEHSFSNATPFSIQQGDVLVTWVLLDPCNPPREIMLEFNSAGSLEHRAIWGDDLIGRGSIGTPSKYRAGPLPAAGAWVRLEVPAAMVGLDNATVTGMSFDLFDGQAWFDRAGTASRVNLALGKPATQSSLFASDTGPGKAVDGDLGGDFGKSQVAVTNKEAQAWWQVDLGASQPIETVQLWNRTDCCGFRLAGFWLFVSDTPFTSFDPNVTRAQFGVSSYRYDAAPGGNLTFLVNRTGRYVRVQLIDFEFLQLAEVQVWAPASPLMVNLAGGRSVSASSILAGYNSGPERAVNGNTDPDFNRELSVMHTDNTGPQPWFEVDLGSVQAISTADIWNRSDYILASTTNFYVFVSDVPFVSKDVSLTIGQSGVSTFYWGSVASIGYSVPINRTGRYVRVQLTGNPSPYLYLAEVQVWSQAMLLGPLTVNPPKTSFDFRSAMSRRASR